MIDEQTWKSIERSEFILRRLRKIRRPKGKPTIAKESYYAN